MEYHTEGAQEADVIAQIWLLSILVSSFLKARRQGYAVGGKAYVLLMPYLSILPERVLVLRMRR